MITKDELRRRVLIAKYPRRGDAKVHEAPDHNPLILEDCPTCRGTGHKGIDENGQASLWECPICKGSGITGNLGPYFTNDEPIISVGLNSYGWITCPLCNFRFSPRDKHAWSGLRHFGCGQRLVIAPVDIAIDSSLRETLAFWEDGLLARGEMEDRLFELVIKTDIDKVLARLPQPWHDAVLKNLQSWAEDEDREPITIFGGIYKYEMEPDPAKAAEMKREVQEEQAADTKHLKEIVIPMIRDWWIKRRNADHGGG